MDKNSISFQMFLILLSFIHFINLEPCQRNTQISVVISFFLGGGEGACAKAKSLKKTACSTSLSSISHVFR